MYIPVLEIRKSILSVVWFNLQQLDALYVLALWRGETGSILLAVRFSSMEEVDHFRRSYGLLEPEG